MIEKEKDKFPFIALGHSMSLLGPLAHSVGSGGMDIVNCSVKICLSHFALVLSVLETTQILTQCCGLSSSKAILMRYVEILI